jgi:hypothetical protein
VRVPGRIRIRIRRSSSLMGLGGEGRSSRIVRAPDYVLKALHRVFDLMFACKASLLDQDNSYIVLSRPPHFMICTNQVARMTESYSQIDIMTGA